MKKYHIGENVASDEKAESSSTCVVCMDGPKEICFVPCGHVSCCSKCSDKLDVCCICKQKIDKKVKVFIS